MCIKPCCVRGYNVYKAIWAAAIREGLVCDRESNNDRDRHAVAVIMNHLISYLDLAS